MKSIEVPTLDHDAMMFAKYGHKVHPTGRLERRIVAALCAHLHEHGWQVRSVYDGEISTSVTDAKSAMELIFNLDESRVYFCNLAGRSHWVLLVNGNGIDMISDYSYSEAPGDTFDRAMEAFNSEEYA